VLQNLIGSHDTERFLTLCNGDVAKLKLAALFQMTYVGAPMIYYGDEIGMEGGKDPDCRRTMIWDESKWNQDLLKWYQTLVKIRNDYPALRRGLCRTVLVDTTSKLFGFVREGLRDRALTVLNNGPVPVSLAGKLTELSSERWFDAVTDRELRKPLFLETLSIPARSGLILISPGFD
jgi:glycosidase